MIRVSCWKTDLIVLLPLIPRLEKHTEEKGTEENPHGECSGAELSPTTNSTAELSLRFFYSLLFVTSLTDHQL